MLVANVKSYPRASDNLATSPRHLLPAPNQNSNANTYDVGCYARRRRIFVILTRRSSKHCSGKTQSVDSRLHANPQKRRRRLKHSLLEDSLRPEDGAQDRWSPI